MNTESIDCRRVEGHAQATQPGDFFWWFHDGQEPGCKAKLYIILPGETVVDCVPVLYGPTQKEREWEWDGNADKPTLSPSIDYGGHWHGYLEKGHLRSC